MHCFGSTRTAEDASPSDLLQTYWTNFAKTGNPNASGLPNWPAWSDEEKEFLVVNQDASVTAQRNFPPLFSRLGANELKQGFKANQGLNHQPAYRELRCSASSTMRQARSIAPLKVSRLPT